MNNPNKYIDVSLSIKEKIPSTYKKLPNYVFRLIERIILQDEMNSIIQQSSHLQGIDMVNWILRFFGIKVKVQGQHLIPINGRNIFPANHPTGGLDGLSVITEIAKIDTNTKFIVNDLLRVVKGLESLCIYIARFGNINRRDAKSINEAFSSDINIILHPAGSVSKRNPLKICDLEWNKFFIRKAIQFERNVIPIHIKGCNSNFFYNIATIRKLFFIQSNFEMFLLPREMFNKKGHTIRITFGKPIPYNTFDTTKTNFEWAQKVREYVYLIGNGEYSSPNMIPDFKSVL
jgi:putative hemolysin